MAKALSGAERRRLAADFDPPPAPKTHDNAAAPLTDGKRVRVTASLTQAQYELLKTLAKRRGLSMSRVLGEAVESLRKQL